MTRESLGVTPTKRKMSSSISPPPLGRRQAPSEQSRHQKEPGYVSSPFRLTKIRDLTTDFNHDTVSLGDLIGDPLIKECWIFDFLFDVDFVMQHFDSDIRGMVKVRIVHGSWRNEDSNRKGIEEALKRYPNVEAVTAYMPEAFGCHHSKIMVLFRNDDTAQVIIHTANMIAQDWNNMCQGVWASPHLPLIAEDNPEKVKASRSPDDQNSREQSPGSGSRFKDDLLRYIAAYGQKRTGSLVNQLKLYDFSSVRAALVASVPSALFKEEEEAEEEKRTGWGWPALKNILATVPSTTKQVDRPCIVAQVSSVATLGEKWISHFLDVLSTTEQDTTNALQTQKKPRCRIMFPTADEIRRSIDGYAAGSSIHMKLQSAAAKKQLALLHPMLVHWAGDNIDSNTWSQLTLSGAQSSSGNNQTLSVRGAGRRRAAPHIKTYIRYASEAMDRIDWAMLTSANLSTQAWGAMEKDGRVRICSYEIGVVVWPGLFEDNHERPQNRDGQGGNEHAGDKGKSTVEDSGSETESDPEIPASEPAKPGCRSVMVPTFMKDAPSSDDRAMSPGATIPTARKVLGLRLPYDLPLVPYQPDENPWCKELEYEEPDWKGVVWPST